MYSPNSLLRESVTGGELHRHRAFFTGTGLASYRQMRALPCATLYHHLRRPETKDDANGAKGMLAGPPATTGPLPGGGVVAPPRKRAYLREMPCSVRLGEGPGSRPLSCSPQCAPPGREEAAELGKPSAAMT